MTGGSRGQVGLLWGRGQERHARERKAKVPDVIFAGSGLIVFQAIPLFRG